MQETWPWGQPLAPPGEGGSSGSSSGSTLPPPTAPPPLEPPSLAKRGLEQETEMTDATVKQQGESREAKGASRSTPSRGQQWQWQQQQ